MVDSFKTLGKRLFMKVWPTGWKPYRNRRQKRAHSAAKKLTAIIPVNNFKKQSLPVDNLLRKGVDKSGCSDIILLK
jgi:hypothetical protein